jgi:hypothetical protein
MAHLSVPGSELLIGIDFARHPRFSELLSGAEDAVVLFPAEGARDASELAARPGGFTAFVIDGTWSQAKKVWQANPALQRLPAYRISPRLPSRYEIRAEPAVHCLSTIEAVAELLDAIDGAPGKHEPMLAPFLGMVSRQQLYANGATRSPRWRTRTIEPRPPPQLPGLLRNRPDDALIVHAEGNGWPRAMENRPPTELVHLVAVRPATGETFSSVVKPSFGLSPRSVVLGMAPERFAAAAGIDTLRQEWSRFVRPQDVPLLWGSFSRTLLGSAGIGLGAAVDLQQWASERLGQGAGGIEAAHAAFGLPASRAEVLEGRGGRRLALMEALFLELLKRHQAACGQ